MNKRLPIQQGDLLFIPVDAIPKGAKPVARENGRLILALGETTGHSHSVLDADAELFATGTGDAADKWLRLGQSGIATVLHQEHSPSVLTEPIYEVRRQNQHTPAAIRRVSD